MAVLCNFYIFFFCAIFIKIYIQFTCVFHVVVFIFNYNLVVFMPIILWMWWFLNNYGSFFRLIYLKESLKIQKTLRETINLGKKSDIICFTWFKKYFFLIIFEFINVSIALFQDCHKQNDSRKSDLKQINCCLPWKNYLPIRMRVIVDLLIIYWSVWPSANYQKRVSEQ